MRPHARSPQVASSIEELQALRVAFGDERVAFVPTMGALHDGHRSLMRLAHQHADRVVVSIFVNPLQFGPGEDYARYPRVLEHDLDVCAAEGVDIVFTPTVHELYPPGRQVLVNAGQLGTVLEGASRPGHFDGVLTVVLKLFNIVRPHLAIFGQKDAQQLACLRRMVVDLNVTVDILGAPIIREPDGLALSSRNRFLSLTERASALNLSMALRAAAAHHTRDAVLAAGRARLDQAEAGDPSFRVDYFTVVNPQTFAELPNDFEGEAVALVAARVGSTRLIDNMVVQLQPEEPGCGPRQDLSDIELSDVE